MDFGKVFSNPIVLGGGALLGVVLLLNRGGGSAPQPSQVIPIANSAAMEMNKASMNAVTRQFEIGADLGKARIQGDVATQLGFFATMQNESNNARQVETARIDSRKGIINTMLVSQAAVTQSHIETMGRTQQIWIGADAQKTQSNNQVEIARIQAKAAKKAAKYGLFGDIIGGITTTAAAVATGGTSLIAQGAAKAAGSMTNNQPVLV